LDKFGVDAKDADDVIALEISQICHEVKHNLSYNSLDSTSKSNLPGFKNCSKSIL